jgi:hypothetical protein
VPVRRLVECRAVRAVVLLLAFGVGGVAGAPAMALPPRPGWSISGGPNDPDDDDPDDGGPIGPPSPQPGTGSRDRTVDESAHPVLV